MLLQPCFIAILSYDLQLMKATKRYPLLLFESFNKNEIFKNSDYKIIAQRSNLHRKPIRQLLISSRVLRGILYCSKLHVSLKLPFYALIAVISISKLSNFQEPEVWPPRKLVSLSPFQLNTDLSGKQVDSKKINSLEKVRNINQAHINNKGNLCWVITPPGGRPTYSCFCNHDAKIMIQVGALFLLHNL